MNKLGQKKQLIKTFSHALQNKIIIVLKISDINSREFSALRKQIVFGKITVLKRTMLNRILENFALSEIKCPGFRLALLLSNDVLQDVLILKKYETKKNLEILNISIDNLNIDKNFIYSLRTKNSPSIAYIAFFYQRLMKRFIDQLTHIKNMCYNTLTNISMIENDTKLSSLLNNINELEPSHKIALLKEALVNISVNDWLVLADQLAKDYKLETSDVSTAEKDEDSEEEGEKTSLRTIAVTKLPEGLAKCFPIYKLIAQIKGADILTVRNEINEALKETDQKATLEKRIIKRDATQAEVDELVKQFKELDAELEII